MLSLNLLAPDEFPRLWPLLFLAASLNKDVASTRPILFFYICPQFYDSTVKSWETGVNDTYTSIVTAHLTVTVLTDIKHLYYSAIIN